MFNNIIALFSYFFSVDGYENLKENVEDIHFNIFATLGVIFGIMLIALIVNLCGGLALNIYLALLVNAIIIFVASMPKLLAIPAFAGMVKEKNMEGSAKFLSAYAKAVCHILLPVSAMLLFLGTIPVKGNPNIVVFAIVVGLLMTWTDIVWGWKTKTFQKITYILIVLSVILNLMFLVPDSIYRYLFDWAPSDVSIEKIEQSGKKGVLIKGIKSVYKAAENAAEKAKLEAEIAALRAAAAKKAAGEEAAKNLERGNKIQAGEININEPRTIEIPLDPYESCPAKISVAEGLKFSLNATRGADFYITMLERNNKELHIVHDGDKSPPNMGTFTLRNGGKKSKILVVAY